MKVQGGLSTFCGLFLALSAAGHGLAGWPAMGGQLAKLGADPATMGGFWAGWQYGTAAMLVFAVIMLDLGRRLWRGESASRVPAAAIGTGYLVFGAAAFVIRGYEPFFLLFVATGILAGSVALGGRKTEV